MRKCFSNLVMTAMLLVIMAPFIALSPQALPACCRAGGEHHCAAMVHLGGEGFRAQMPPCPFLQHPAVSPAHSALHVQRVLFSITHTYENFSFIGLTSVASATQYSVPQRGPPLA